MSLLENELIKKYFGPGEGAMVECCEHEINRVGERVKRDMAFAVLQAMQEPIKKGERCLQWDVKGPCGESKFYEIEYGCELGKSFHPTTLRLPDAHQKKECEHKHEWVCGCGLRCKHGCMCCDMPKPAPEPEIKRTCEDKNHLPGCVCSAPEKCGICNGSAHLPSDCPQMLQNYHKPSAVADLIQQIQLDIYAKVQGEGTADLENLRGQLNTLVRLAREG